jgi:murein hydrolase activator
VLIGAPEGREVKAIHQGRVVFSEYMRGQGMLIIIDHGDNYLSLYAHNQVLYKETGDWVADGEVIARVGASGGQSKPSLYFEIRHAGKPLDPSHWCRG